MIIPIDPKTRGLIFDLDGTLVDSMPAHYEAWKTIIKKHGHDLTKERLYSFGGIPTNKVAASLIASFGLTIEPDALVAEKEEEFLKNVDGIKIIEPVFEIVKKYQNKLPMSIGTGGVDHIASILIKNAGLDKYFKIIVTADDVAEHKPLPETFLKCAELMNVPPESCQVFEDAENGILAAKNAGMIITDLRDYL